MTANLGCQCDGPGKEKPQWRNCLYQNGLWHVCRSFFLIKNLLLLLLLIDVQGSNPVIHTILREVGLGCIKKKLMNVSLGWEQASKQHSPWLWRIILHGQEFCVKFLSCPPVWWGTCKQKWTLSTSGCFGYLCLPQQHKSKPEQSLCQIRWNILGPGDYRPGIFWVCMGWQSATRGEAAVQFEFWIVLSQRLRGRRRLACAVEGYFLCTDVLAESNFLFRILSLEGQVRMDHTSI